MDQMLESLSTFEKDTSWFFRNKDKLLEDYENEFVAIENARVIDSDKDIDGLIKRLEGSGKNPATTVIKYVKKLKSSYNQPSV